jgi:hypothetical protein
VALNGTVQDIYARLIEINPTYDRDFAARVPQARSNDDEAPHLQKRFDIKCNNHGSANLKLIKEGIAYLYGVRGKPTIGPGPGKCGRVSCSWSAAIWWCNDVSVCITTTLPELIYFINPRTPRQKPLMGSTTLPIVLRLSSTNVAQTAMSLAKRIMRITGEALLATVHAELTVGD